MTVFYMLLHICVCFPHFLIKICRIKEKKEAVREAKLRALAGDHSDEESKK